MYGRRSKLYTLLCKAPMSQLLTFKPVRKFHLQGNVVLVPVTLLTVLEEMDTFPPFLSLLYFLQCLSSPRPLPSLLLLSPLLLDRQLWRRRRSRGMSDREIASILRPSYFPSPPRCQSPEIAITASDNWAPNTRPTFSAAAHFSAISQPDREKESRGER